MRLITLVRAALMVAAATLPGSGRADILVVSQNGLHIGQNSASVPGYLAGKNTFFQSLAHWPGSTLPQLTFLQEVMAQATESAIQPQGGTVHFGALKGTTSYLERYGTVLVNDAGNHVSMVCRVDVAGLVSAGTVLQRPPDATLVRDTSDGTARFVWFLNFHATFGTGAAVRRREITEIGNVVAKLRASVPAACPRTSDNVVVLGDWNLSGTDVAFRTLATNAGFQSPGLEPNVPTSLNASGVRISPYDHFAWDKDRIDLTLAQLPSQQVCNTTATFALGILTPADSLSFRKRCSDHLGVAAVVRIR